MNGKQTAAEFAQDLKTIKALTVDELRTHLITCDYRGKEFKTLVLDELLERKFDETYDNLREAIDGY